MSRRVQLGRLTGGLIAVAVLTAACGGSSTKAASSTSSSSSSSSTSPSSSSRSSSASAADGLPAGLVACDLFDLASLNALTNLTWKVADRSAADSCAISADNGNAVAINLVPTQGQNDQVLPGAKAACDAGTFKEQALIDGGYVCTVSGIASAGALFKGDNVFVAISAQTFNGATLTEIQAALIDVLKSFQAPSGTSS